MKKILKVLILLGLIGNLSFSKYKVEKGIIYYENMEIVDFETDSLVKDKGLKILNDKYAINGKDVYFIGIKINKNDIDINTLEALDDFYLKDKNNVYFGDKNINVKDVKNFKILNENFAKDSENVYVFGKRIKGVDINTFQIMEDYYSKDKDNVYYLEKKIEGIDLSTLESLGKGFIRDKNNLFRYGEKMEEIDINSFKILSDGVVKDKNNVYGFDRKIIEADVNTYEEIEDSYYSKDKNSLYYIEKKIQNSSPKNFEILDSDLIRTESGIYFEGKKIEVFDPKNFEIIKKFDMDYYVKDSKNIYYLDNYVLSEEGELKTLNILQKSSNTFEPLSQEYSKDGNRAYYISYYRIKRIENIDNKTFEVLDFQYAKDKNSVYLMGTKLENVSPEDFEIVYKNLHRHYIKNKDGIYEIWISEEIDYFTVEVEKIENVDKDSFEAFSGTYVRDKNNFYYNGYPDKDKMIKMEDVDVETFEILDKEGYCGKDKNNMYCLNKKVEKVEF